MFLIVRICQRQASNLIYSILVYVREQAALHVEDTRGDAADRQSTWYTATWHSRESLQAN